MKIKALTCLSALAVLAGAANAPSPALAQDAPLSFNGETLGESFADFYARNHPTCSGEAPGPQRPAGGMFPMARALPFSGMSAGNDVSADLQKRADHWKREKVCVVKPGFEPRVSGILFNIRYGFDHGKLDLIHLDFVSDKAVYDLLASQFGRPTTVTHQNYTTPEVDNVDTATGATTFVRRQSETYDGRTAIWRRPGQTITFYEIAGQPGSPWQNLGYALEGEAYIEGNTDAPSEKLSPESLKIAEQFHAYSDSSWTKVTSIANPTLNWVFFMRQDQFHYFRGTSLAWIRIQNMRPEQPDPDSGNRKFTHALGALRFNCNTRKAAMVAMAYDDSHGQIDTNTSYYADRPLDAQSPGSVESSLMDALCVK